MALLLSTPKTFAVNALSGWVTASGSSLSWGLLLVSSLSFARVLAAQAPNYSVKWTAAMSRGNLTPTVAAATYLKR